MPDLLRALVRLTYARKAHLPGEKFICEPSHAKVLVLAKQAERVDEDVPALLAPRPVASESQTYNVAALDPPRRKRGRPRKNEYRTRDMRAE